MNSVEPSDGSEEDEPLIRAVLKTGVAVAIVSGLIVWKAVGLGYSYLSGLMTALGLFTVFAVGALVVRYMIPK